MSSSRGLGLEVSEDESLKGRRKAEENNKMSRVGLLTYKDHQVLSNFSITQKLKRIYEDVGQMSFEHQPPQ